MQNTNSTRLGLLALAALLLVFPACDADVTSPSADSIVGTWQITRLELTPVGFLTGRELISLGATGTAQFGADGHFSFTLSERDGIVTKLAGSWSLARGKLTIQVEGAGSTGTFQVWLSGPTLALTGGVMSIDLDGNGVAETTRMDMMFEPR